MPRTPRKNQEERVVSTAACGLVRVSHILVASMRRKRSASWHGSGNVGVANIRITRPARKPKYGAYAIVSRAATALSPRLYRALVSLVRPDRPWLGFVLPASLYHRVHFHRRSGGPRPLVLLPSVLFALCLVLGRSVSRLGTTAPRTLRSGRPHCARWRRHAVPQTRSGLVRCGYAPRPAVLQQGTQSLFLGPQLG